MSEKSENVMPEETPKAEEATPPVTAEAADEVFDEVMETLGEAEPAPAEEPSAAEAEDEGKATVEAAGEEPETPEEPKAEGEEPKVEEKKEEEPPQPSVEELEAQYKAWREEAEKQLSQHYALDDEAYSALEENPREMLPRLLSRVYLDAVQGAAASVLQELPRLVQGVMQQGTVAQEAENAFFSKWKNLNDPKYYDDIVRVAQAYRATDPNIPQDRLIDLVGVQVSLLHNLPIEGAEAGAQEVQAEPPAHQPAGREGVPEAPERTEANPFAVLAEEMDEEGI